MKNYIFILSFFTHLCFSQNDGIAFYTQLSFRKFIQLEQINKTIDTLDVDYELLRALLFHLTNEERKKYRRKRLIYSLALDQSAQEHSQDMAKLNFFSHTSSIQEKRSLYDRINLVNFTAYSMGENIASNYTSTEQTYLDLAENVIELWMLSPGHKRNILDSKFTHIGCGGYINKNRELLSTQNFTSNPI